MSIKTIVGRVGKDAELRVTQNGKQVVSFSVAETKRRFNQQTNQWEDQWTIWHDVECWRNTNGLALLRKGEQVIVLGEEQDASYENREGRKASKVKLNAQHVGRVVTDRDAVDAAQTFTNSAPAASGESWATPGGFDANTPF